MEHSKNTKALATANKLNKQRVADMDTKKGHNGSNEDCPSDRKRTMIDLPRLDSADISTDKTDSEEDQDGTLQTAKGSEEEDEEQPSQSNPKKPRTSPPAVTNPPCNIMKKLDQAAQRQQRKQEHQGTEGTNHKEASPSTPDPDPVAGEEPASKTQGSKRGRKASQPFPPEAMPVLAAFLTALESHRMPRSQEQVAADFLWAYKKGAFKNVGCGGAAPAKKEIKEAVKQIKKPGSLPKEATDDSVVAAAQAAVKLIRQRHAGAEAWPSVMEEMMEQHQQQQEQLLGRHLKEQKQLCQRQHQELFQVWKEHFAQDDE